ncbi:dual specificity protein phosphatase, partial [Striga asiatica]
MAIPKANPKAKSTKPRSPFLILTTSIACIAVLYLASSLLSTPGLSASTSSSLQGLVNKPKNRHTLQENTCIGAAKSIALENTATRVKVWGTMNLALGVPLKRRCFLGEVIILLVLSQWTFVMPSRMCINPIHNKKGILHQAGDEGSEEGWTGNSCAMESLYDMDLMSETIPVILDNSKMWHHVLTTSMKLGPRGIAHVQGVNRADLKENALYSNLLLINRTASPLSWFMECKDRNNRNSILLPYSFLPSMAAKKFRDAAQKIKALLGDYDAIHVRRGDKLKTRKDRFGVQRSLHPHLDRDTRPEFILCRISKWVPPRRTLYIASNERTPGFFSPLAARLIMMGAKTFIRTFKEDDTDLSLTDDPKKNTKIWHVLYWQYRKMPYLVREHLFIGNIGDAAEVLQNGSDDITHILSVLSSASISFFSEWRSGISIPTKEIRKVFVGDSDSENGSKSALSPDKLLYSLEYAGKDLKFVRMAVPLRDMESEDLLDYLDAALDFIENSRKEGSVLVHCFAGVSRSAAIITAYLMKSERLTVDDAIESLRQSCESVCPNDGFLEQLKMFEEMGFKVDRGSPIYKRFRLKVLGESYNCGEKIDISKFGPDPSSLAEKLSSHSEKLTNNEARPNTPAYRCKKCRRLVALKENAVDHVPGEGETCFNWRKRSGTFSRSEDDECSSIFIEPLCWMKADSELSYGTISHSSLSSSNYTQLKKVVWRESYRASTVKLVWVTSTGPAFSAVAGAGLHLPSSFTKAESTSALSRSFFPPVLPNFGQSPLKRVWLLSPQVVRSRTMELDSLPESVTFSLRMPKTFKRYREPARIPQSPGSMDLFQDDKNN